MIEKRIAFIILSVSTPPMPLLKCFIRLGCVLFLLGCREDSKKMLQVPLKASVTSLSQLHPPDVERAARIRNKVRWCWLTDIHCNNCDSRRLGGFMVYDT